MKNTLTIEFLKDYSPRKKGEIVSFTGREGLRTANWYLSNSVAKEYCGCNDTDHKEGCTECEKLLSERTPMTSKNFKAENSNTVVEVVTSSVDESKPKKKTKK